VAALREMGPFPAHFAAMNLRFAGLFAPEGVRPANFFPVLHRFAEIPEVFGVFEVSPGNDPETIIPGNCPNVH
jgi:hypothetical protein